MFPDETIMCLGSFFSSCVGSNCTKFRHDPLWHRQAPEVVFWQVDHGQFLHLAKTLRQTCQLVVICVDVPQVGTMANFLRQTLQLVPWHMQTENWFGINTPILFYKGYCLHLKAKVSQICRGGFAQMKWDQNCFMINRDGGSKSSYCSYLQKSCSCSAA